MARKLLAIVSLGLLGLVADRFALVLVSGLEIRFGSFFYLTAAILTGPLGGAIAALLTSASEIGRPLLPMLAITEAVAVGAFVRFGRLPAAGSVVFWVLIGFPAITWLEPLVLRLQLAELYWLEGLHRTFNGLLNAVVASLVADLLLRQLPKRSWSGINSPRRKLGSALAYRSALLATLPVMALGVWFSRTQATERLTSTLQLLDQSTESTLRLVESHIDRHLDALHSVAAGLEAEPSADLEAPDFAAEMAKRLAILHGVYPTFVSLLIATEDGQIQATSPELPPSLPIEQRSVSDRPYFTHPMKTGEAFVSEPFEGRGFGTDPIVALATPVQTPEGRVVAVVEGSIRAFDLGKVLPELSTESAAEVLLLSGERVLAAPDTTGYQPLEFLPPDSFRESLSRYLVGTQTPELEELSPVERLEARAIKHLRSPGYPDRSWILEVQPMQSAKWQVVTRLPAGVLTSAAERLYAWHLTWALAAAAAAYALAWLLALRVTRPLSRLVTWSETLGSGVESGQMLLLQANAPAEVAELFDHFSQLEERLEESYGELRTALDEKDSINQELENVLGDLDRRVRERTREMVEAKQVAEDNQQHFRDLVENIDAIVWEFDLDTNKTTFVSSRLKTILGYPDARWILEPDLKVNIQSEDRKRITGILRTAEPNKGALEYEYRIRSADGRLVWLHDAVRALEGEQRLVRGLTWDVTEQHLLQDELLRAQRLESVGQLAGGIAHDFNNFLTGVAGLISVAKVSLDDRDVVRDSLEEAEQATQQAVDLAHRLLSLSRKGLPVRSVQSIKELVRETVQLTLSGTKVHEHFELPNDLWETEVDVLHIEQVVQNLTQFSLHVMPEGGSLRVTGSNLKLDRGNPYGLEPSAYVQLAFRDQGGHIDAAQVSRIFDPYFTLQSGGTGLGLFASYSLVKRNNGLLSAESDPGKGTTFHLLLPAVQPASQAKEATLGPASMSGRVLIMDDEKTVRTALSRMLSHLGLETTTAPTGDEAARLYRLALARGDRFDVVIMDLTIRGGMGAVKTLESLQAIDPGVCGVVTSGHVNDPVLVHFDQHGFAAAAGKPFTLNQWRSLLGRLLHENAAV